MQDPGHLIALSVLLLYTILGPPVLLALYTLFDSLSGTKGLTGNHRDVNIETVDPALWTSKEILTYMSRI